LFVPSQIPILKYSIDVGGFVPPAINTREIGELTHDPLALTQGNEDGFVQGYPAADASYVLVRRLVHVFWTRNYLPYYPEIRTLRGTD
jgi:hypothetical protein